MRPFEKLQKSRNKFRSGPLSQLGAAEKCCPFSETIFRSRFTERSFAGRGYAQYFALCNGGRFTLFDIHDQVPLMNIELSQLELKWPTLVDFLSPDSFRRVVDAPKKSAGATAARLSKYQAAGGNNGFS